MANTKKSSTKKTPKKEVNLRNNADIFIYTILLLIICCLAGYILYLKFA